MGIQKYLIGIWAAIAVYTLFSILGGANGISAYNYLLAEKEYQWENIRDLGILNEELERTRSNLLYDQDTVLVNARFLGYGQEEERFIRIVGLENSSAVSVASGNVYFAHAPDFISDRNIKIAALCTGLLLFTFLAMLEIIEKRTR